MKTAVTRAREEVARFEAQAARAQEIAGTLGSLQQDIARLEAKRDRFSVFGKERIEVANPYRVESYKDVELEPFHSRLTGAELAEGVEATAEQVRAEIARLEAELESFDE